MIEDEKRMRDSLLGNTSDRSAAYSSTSKQQANDTNAIKSKLSSLIKMKPKSRKDNPGSTKQERRERRPPCSTSTDKDDAHQALLAREPASKRKPSEIDEVDEQYETSNQEKRVLASVSEATPVECACHKDVARTPPSLPIVLNEAAGYHSASSNSDSDDDEICSWRVLPNLSTGSHRPRRTTR